MSKSKEELLIEALATEEGRQLVQSMGEPIRCGGVEYRRGVAYIFLGGMEYPYKEFFAAYEANGRHFPEKWCKEYKEAHAKDLVTGPAEVVIE